MGIAVLETICKEDFRRPSEVAADIPPLLCELFCMLQFMLRIVIGRKGMTKFNIMSFIAEFFSLGLRCHKGKCLHED